MRRTFSLKARWSTQADRMNMVIALIQNAIDMNVLNEMLMFLLLCAGGFVSRYRLLL